MQLEEKQKIVEALYAKMHSKVNGLCSRYIYNFHEREDVVQDVFLTLFKYLDGFDGRCKIETWLYTIAKTRCLNHIRMQHAHKRRGFLVELTGFNGPTSKATQLESLIADEAMEKLEEVCVHAGYGEYDSIHCFMLAHKSGLSYQQISESLGVRNTTVRARISRGKKLLRQRLRKHGPIV